ncbi:MAG TPA: YbaK/EbsC family protein [Longilinea sp.]|nr:YbaK/EbsC family protein [Longilinea sp.]
MQANNVTRLLAARKIPYTAFDLPIEKLGAIETARRLGVPEEIVFKTIVVKRDKPGKPLLVVIPGNHEVDLKALAEVLGEKKVILPTQREAESLTGLQAGGISPLALVNKGFQVIIDQSAIRHEQIHISGGQLGLNIRLPVAALTEICRARIALVSKRMENPGAEEE